MKKEDKLRGLKGSLALLSGVSTLAMANPAFSQAVVEDEEGDVIIVRGIASSLKASQDLKRDSQGVVDALTAEDIGDFPDTNLAESLQRITGVSIDRRNGEGSSVTVRGFGPAFNLVLLNGRQMPTAFIEGGAPSSRSFDFGNLASEGIASVEIYKTGRADLPTGGIGSTLNIKTARPLDAPGLRFSAGVKGVYDDSVTSIGDTSVTPEVSAIFSNTFMDKRVGIALVASYQDRESGVAQFGTSSGWRGAYRGDENNWGTLPPSDSGRVENRPGDDDIYSVPQNGNYGLSQIDRERINGQVVLQARPIDRVTATLDYFYSQNKVQTDTNDLSVWFNHGNTESAWGNGPISDILFYNETFSPGFSDLSMGASRNATISESDSIGINVEYELTDNFTLTVDAHSSSAESRPDSPFGSSGVISTADFGLGFQGLDFRNELPVLSLGFNDGATDIAESRMLGTGSTFQASTIRTEIDQLQVFGNYEFDQSIVTSIDFGAAVTKNDFRSTFSNNQRDSWGGVGTPDDYPDDIWQRANLADNFDQLSGYQDTFQDFFVVDFDRLIEVMDDPNFRPYVADGVGVGFEPLCGGDGVCTADTVQVDRRTEEESFSAFVQINTEFEIGNMPSALFGGVRYEQTDVTSEALVGFPTGTVWVAANEFGLTGLNDPANRDFTRLEGDYDFWLPAVDFQVQPMDNVLLRASYSHTMTRPGYADIQGGQTVDQLFRLDGGTGRRGNPGLEPFLSRNIDLSAEYYYSDSSYISLGYFYKEVENFIGTTVVEGQTPFDVATPIGGQRFNDAVAATGSQDSDVIRQWIFNNSDPSTFEVFFVDGNGFVTGNIFGVPGEDPLVPFRIEEPVNSDETKSVDGWEFAWQHLLGDSGFGWIFNYTIVDGDVTFDNNTVPSDGIVQEPLIGLSDSYNIQAFYDKHGFQARLAYNWRDQFLTSFIGVSGLAGNPLYVQEFGQLDFNASYDVNEKLTVFVEGINVLDETRTVVGRSDAYINFATQTGARYQFGARYRF
ncbi:MAG: TonB-dependent receptor [Pseudomonadota bacterium]